MDDGYTTCKPTLSGYMKRKKAMENDSKKRRVEKCYFAFLDFWDGFLLLFLGETVIIEQKLVNFIELARWRCGKVGKSGKCGKYGWV